LLLHGQFLQTQQILTLEEVKRAITMKDRSADLIEHYWSTRRRASHCHGVEVRDFFGMLRDQFRHCPQETTSYVGGSVLPGLECCFGCLDGFLDVLFIALADIDDFLSQ
jgi:hypothetical protein